MQIDIDKEEKYIKNQLDRLDKQKSIIPFIGAVSSLLISLGIGMQMKILIHWIPASFILFLLWTLYSILKIRKNSLTVKGAKQSLDSVDKFNRKTWEYATELMMKNQLPLIKSTAIILMINVIVVLFYLSKIITLPFNGLFEPLAVLIFSLSFIFVFLGAEKFPKFFSSTVLNSMKKFPQLEKDTRIPSPIRQRLLPFLILGLGIFLFIVIIIYIWTIYLLLPLISENIWFLIVVISTQLIFIFSMWSYFSLQQVKYELELSLLIIGGIRTGEFNEDELLESIRFTKYGISNQFKYLNIYVIIPNNPYLKYIQEKQTDNTQMNNPSIL